MFFVILVMGIGINLKNIKNFMLEKYQPDSEEIQKAEDSMTDQQAQMSKIREEGYHLGMVDAKKKKRKKW